MVVAELLLLGHCAKPRFRSKQGGDSPIISVAIDTFHRRTNWVQIENQVFFQVR